MPLGSSRPCQWMVVCSGSLLVTKMRTLSPSIASMVGPGELPLYPHRCAVDPGANSRSTGSATRWNSLTSPFMRHGSEPAVEGDEPGASAEPLLRQRVAGGRVGEALRLAQSAGVCLGDAGQDGTGGERHARRESTSAQHRSVLTWSQGPRGGGGRGRLGQAPAQKLGQLGIGDPELGERGDVFLAGLDLLAGGVEELVHVQEHRVVVELQLPERHFG